MMILSGGAQEVRWKAFGGERVKVGAGDEVKYVHDHVVREVEETARTEAS